MAEGHSIAAITSNLSLKHHDRLILYNKPQVFSQIANSGYRSWRLRFSERYNRFSKTVYPAKVSSLGVWGSFALGMQYYPNYFPEWLKTLHTYNVAFNKSILNWSLQKAASYHTRLCENKITGLIYPTISRMMSSFLEPIWDSVKNLAAKLGITNKDCVWRITTVGVSWFICVLFARYYLKYLQNGRFY